MLPGMERVDRLTGTRVVVVPSRQDRPNRPEEGCPFCPGGLEAPDPYRVRWFPNRWPALPDGRSEVVLYTPDHDSGLGRMTVEEIGLLVDLWAERTTALGSRPDVAYVLVFENRGPEVGATIDHPHGQIYAYDSVPPVPARELAFQGDGPCPLCEPAPESLVVWVGGHWVAWAPEASGWPFELVLAPRRHVPDLPAAAADPACREGLARTLREAARRLDGLFSRPMPYMMWCHQRPTDGAGWPAAHLHLHVCPVLRAPGTQRYVAGAEVGGGVMFNPVDPEEAAARLRAVGPEGSR